MEGERSAFLCVLLKLFYIIPGEEADIVAAAPPEEEPAMAEAPNMSEDGRENEAAGDGDAGV